MTDPTPDVEAEDFDPGPVPDEPIDDGDAGAQAALSLQEREAHNYRQAFADPHPIVEEAAE